MIYFIITTCLINNCIIRKEQYIKSIAVLKDIIYNKKIENYQIIIVENNGLRKTYLDDLGCKVYYTINNLLPTNNKGYKELQDVLDTIKTFDIKDTDFIVKMTGRYLLEYDSEFMNVLDMFSKSANREKSVSVEKEHCDSDCSQFDKTHIDIVDYKSLSTEIDCIIKYGYFSAPVDYKTNDCITGLIGMRCFYIKQIENPNENECVEWKWGKATYLIDDNKIFKVKKLGINICPGSNTYILV
jgi:hypothetical protein